MFTFQDLGKKIDESLNFAAEKFEKIYGDVVKNVEDTFFSKEEGTLWYTSKVIGFSKSKSKFVITGASDFEPDGVSLSISYKSDLASFKPSCCLNKETLLTQISFIVIKYKEDELIRFSIPDKIALKTKPFIVDKNRIIVEFDIEEKAL